MSNKFYKEITFWQTNMDYISDDGIIFSTEKKEKFITTQRIREIFDFREADTFMEAVFRLDYTKEVTKRTYMKIQTIIAEVGGFVKGINVIFAILFYFFAKTDYYSVILQKVYFYNGSEEEDIINNSKKNIFRDNQSQLNNLQPNNSRLRLGENSINNNDNLQSENYELKIIDKSNMDKISNLNNFTFKKSPDKFYKIGICNKIIIIFKLCLPSNNKNLTIKTDILRLSIQKIMDRFDCVKYLENFEEMKIVKEILFEEEQNIIINQLKSQKTEMKFNEENTKQEFNTSIKKIGASQTNKNLKLKRIFNKIGLI